MQPITLINGSATRTLSATDRGLSYGQGVFTTLRAVRGEIQHWSLHLKRLSDGCARLGFEVSGLERLLKREIGVLPKDELCIKITLTAGIGPRGYATPEKPNPTRIIQIGPYTRDPALKQGVQLRICQQRLALQPALAGLKHLNRLEQVLARSEWRDDAYFDGIMLDTEGRIVEGTFTNLFWYSKQQLFTPQLTRAGIDGVMRQRVLRLAERSSCDLFIGDYRIEDLLSAEGAFVTNSMVGIVPVRGVDGDVMPAPREGSLTEQLIRLDEEVAVD